jgi:mannose-1-phosphate guanylyltransferase / mannose-6-phosphate isomerase
MSLLHSGPVVPVILSGGSGTRLWPTSRSSHPKQLLPIAGDASMLQATVGRLAETFGFSQPIVVGGEEHRFLISDQLAEAGCIPATILLEPEGRNTAAAIALAALLAHRSNADAILVVAPSDHVIANELRFRSAIEASLPAAEAGHLVTFGIKPDGPETGYGYIEIGSELASVPGVHGVTQFVEKPNAERAQALVADGGHAWNAGIFVFRAGTYLDELNRHAPDIASACRDAMRDATTDRNFTRPARAAFLASPNLSIDDAVMERTDRAAVVPVDIGWSDVGSWDALWNIAPRDDDGNAIDGDVVAIDSHNCLVRVDDGLAVALVGVDDMVVVSTRDSVLVVPRSRSQDVKKIVDELKARNSTRHILQPVVHRPWGTYQTTDIGERFQTKRIVVKPGEQLSLQMHYYRSEHWVVVSGTAVVTIDDREQIVGENQSVYIAAGSRHRLANHGKLPLHLIEVQCGPYLGEDDIVRFEDSYARK